MWPDGRGKGVMMTNSTSVLLLTRKEAASGLSSSARKLWGLTASGEIPHVRIGRCVRYSVHDIEEWIDKNKKGGKP